MIIEPALDKLIEKVDNRYSLVIATAKRARELTDKTDSKTDKPVIDAVHEIYNGTVTVSTDSTEEESAE